MGSGQDHRGRPGAAACHRVQPLSQRVVEVSAARYAAWRERFDANNSGPEARQHIVAVERFDHDPLVLLLVRRGGYAVAVARGGVLAAHKVGTRYVQSRTAAGGWSQQRYARRRANQADELVEATAAHLARLLGEAGGILAGRGTPPGPTGGLVVGGDRVLVDAVLGEPGLAGLRHLPTRALYDVPDPRLEVLRAAVERGSAVRVTISE